MASDKKSAFEEILVVARRQQILDAATRVFAQKGFHGTTIRDVAREAGIADGTIYNYFQNKTALLLGILDRLNETEQRPAHFSEAATGEPEKFLPAYLEHRLAQFSGAGLDMFRVVLPELLVNPELRERYQQEVLAPTFALSEQFMGKAGAAGAEEGGDAEFNSRAIAALVVGLILLRLLDDKYLEAHWQEVPARLGELILRGIPAMRGDSDARTGSDPASGQPGEPGV